MTCVMLPFASLTAWWRGRDALPLRALRLSSFYLRTGKPHAAAAIGLEAMRESPSRVPGLYMNIGSALLWIGDEENADRSFDLFIHSSQSPDEVAQVRQLRARLQSR